MPKLNCFKHNITQNAGTKFQILCSIQEGTKPLTFIWYKDSSPLLWFKSSDKDSTYKISQTEDDSSTLTIARLDQSHSGNYSCQVNGQNGHSDTQFSVLTVKGLFYVYIYIYMYVCMYVCMCVCVCVCNI